MDKVEADYQDSNLIKKLDYMSKEYLQYKNKQIKNCMNT